MLSVFQFLYFSNVFTTANRNKTMPVLSNTFLEPRKKSVNAARFLNVASLEYDQHLTKQTKMPSYPTCQNLGDRLYFYEI